MKHLFKTGVSIAEVVGIFAMLGVLCGAITPHLINVREASQLSKLRFNLEKLRRRIDDYRQRQGTPPDQLDDVFADALSGQIPENPASKSAVRRNRVKLIDSHPPLAKHVTSTGTGGWLYNPTTGGIWADHRRFVRE